MESFAALGVKPWLLNSLAAMQISHPTPIQVQTIPAILHGCDCIGGSKTGSGKTIAFALPILQKWAEEAFAVFALVLTPTRELALQIYEQIKALSASSSLKICLIIGGEDMTSQAIALAKKPHIVVATPGRLADHIKTSGTDTVGGLSRVKFVVLDEADRLLAPGPGSMLPDIDTCFEVLPPSNRRQTLLFTATMTDQVRALKDKPRDKPESLKIVEIGIGAIAVPPTLLQTYILVPATQRETYLHTLLITPANSSRSCIIFCNRTRTANYVEHLLRKLGLRTTALHSSLKQRERINNLARFRAKVASILVATDVASRGLDIPTVDLVINYDVSHDPDDYIHRVGRTARAGRVGLSVTLVGPRDVALVMAIEERVGANMSQYEEENVSIEGRIAKEANLKAVADAKRHAIVQIDEGRDVTGRRESLKRKRTKLL